MAKECKCCKDKLNPIAEFAVETLRAYSDQTKNTVRSTTDLSPLEEWLIICLYKQQSGK